MDDLYEIHFARTEIREGINFGDVARLLSVVDPELVIYCDGQPSEFYAAGPEALKARLRDLLIALRHSWPLLCSRSGLKETWLAVTGYTI